ncbi:hypothetical protein EsH8_IV_000240 [Colletotrichum jinshuiense]
MPKKGKKPGKNQRTRLKARKQRLEMAETLGDQNKPTQRVHVDEKGRRLTVVLGGELEMDKLWTQMKMAQALQSASDEIHKHLDTLRVAVSEAKGRNDEAKGHFEQLAVNAEQLVNRMEDVILENNSQDFGDRMDMASKAEGGNNWLDSLEVVTGFEEQIAEIQASMERLML